MLTYAVVGILLLVAAIMFLVILVRDLDAQQRQEQLEQQRRAFRDAERRIEGERARLRGLVEISRSARERIQ
jgi:hypothetical protein